MHIDREDMLGLTRRMTVSRNCFSRIAGAYMDEEGFIDGTFNTHFLKLSGSEKEKNLIERNAERCGLSVSEYLRQRALGYMPRAVLPEVFFSFNDKLDELCIAVEGKITEDTEISKPKLLYYSQNYYARQQNSANLNYHFRFAVI